MEGLKYQRLGAIATKLRPSTWMIVYAVFAVACLYILGIGLGHVNFFAKSLKESGTDATTTTVARKVPSPYKEMQNKDHRLQWAAPRTAAELEAEKYTTNDTVLESEILNEGYRYSFTPSDVISEIGEQGYTRFTLRVDMQLISGSTSDNRVFIRIDEIDESKEDGFKFNSFAPWPLLNGHVDIPIGDKFMKTWLSKPNATITLNYDIEFGARSAVFRILAKPPVMIFTAKKRSRCDEYACCLSNYEHILETHTHLHSRVVEPRGLELRRCVECSLTHVRYTGNLDTFNMVVHRQIDSDLIPKPVEYGRCRANGFTPLKTQFWYSENDTFYAPEIHFDYFLPTGCKCMEDEEITEDWMERQTNADDVNRSTARNVTLARRAKANGGDAKGKPPKKN